MRHRTPTMTRALVLLLTLTRYAVCADDRPGVAASSVHDPRYQPEYAIDGSPKTRWASAAGTGRPEWLQIDFGKPVPIDSISILWEHAYAVE